MPTLAEEFESSKPVVAFRHERVGAATRPLPSRPGSTDRLPPVPIAARSGPPVDDHGVAHRDVTVVEDVGVEPGPMDQLLDDPRPRQLLQVQARLAQLDPQALDLTDPKRLPTRSLSRTPRSTTCRRDWAPLRPTLSSPSASIRVRAWPARRRPGRSGGRLGAPCRRGRWPPGPARSRRRDRC